MPMGSDDAGFLLVPELDFETATIVIDSLTAQSVFVRPVTQAPDALAVLSLDFDYRRSFLEGLDGEIERDLFVPFPESNAHRFAFLQYQDLALAAELKAIINLAPTYSAGMSYQVVTPNQTSH